MKVSINCEHCGRVIDVIESSNTLIEHFIECVSSSLDNDTNSQDILYSGCPDCGNFNTLDARY